MSWTQTTLTIKDAAGTDRTVIAYTDGTNFSFAHPLLDDTGAIIAPATQGTLSALLTSSQAIEAAVGSIPAAPATAGNQATANTALAAIATNTSGVATAANQATGNTSLATIATNTTGMATAANQATANTALATIATNTTGAATAANQATANTSLAALLTESQNSQRPNIVMGNTTTRPANTTAYAAGQLLANSTTAGSVTFPTIAAARANDQPGIITRLRLKKSGTTLTNGIFRVHLYSQQPTVTNGDGGAWLTTTAGYVGAFDVTMTQAFSDSGMGIGVPTAGSAVAFNPATGTQNLYYLIEVRAAYTPASGEVFTPYVEVQ